MQPISDYKQILGFFSCIKKQKEGFITNYFYNEFKSDFYIKNNRLFYDEISDSIFIIRKHLDFNYIYFISNDSKALNKSLQEFLMKNRNTYVVEIIGKGESQNDIYQIFIDNKFSLQETLIRMSKIYNADQSTQYADPLIFATLKDTDIIFKFLNNNLDKYSEQIPTVEEVRMMINSNYVLIIKKDQDIAGLLYFEKEGSISHLREWHVNKEFREMKIGSKLLKTYFELSAECNRFILWVKENNANSIKIYEHYGYKKELINDKILVLNHGGNN